MTEFGNKPPLTLDLERARKVYHGLAVAHPDLTIRDLSGHAVKEQVGEEYFRLPISVTRPLVNELRSDLIDGLPVIEES